MEPEGLVGDDQDRVGRPATVGVHEPTCNQAGQLVHSDEFRMYSDEPRKYTVGCRVV